MKIQALDTWHWVGTCRCSQCYHSWVGILPVNLSDAIPPPTPLECPSCGKLSGLTSDEGPEIDHAR